MKKVSIIFGFCLFLLVGISCIKPISTTLVRDAYIGSAFSFRINDAISLAYPEMELDKAIELQELVEKHPRLNQIIHKYLCAYGAYLLGDTAVFENMDNEKLFQRLNQDILAETQKRNPKAAPTISEEEFLVQIEAAEAEVESILQNRIPRNLQNYGNLGLAAIIVYGIATSLWTQKGLLLIMALLLTAMYKAASVQQTPDFYGFLGKLLGLHGLFWAVVLPICIKIADWRLLGIVDRILGRSMFLEVAPFLWRGGILVGLSVLFFLMKIFLKKEVRDYHESRDITSDL